MSIPSSQRLRKALSGDLNQKGSKSFAKVVDGAARKTFTANRDGVVFEFSHKQPDNNFWNGVKYYGSGGRSRIRIRRTRSEEPAIC